MKQTKNRDAIDELVDTINNLLSDTTALSAAKWQLSRLLEIVPKLDEGYNEVFDHNQKIGAKRYAWDWITAQQAAIEVMRHFDVDPERKEAKAYVSSIVLAVLDSINNHQK